MLKLSVMKIPSFIDNEKSPYWAAGLLAFFAMQPVLHAGFINWDETGYILDNPLVHALSLHNIAAIFLHPALKLYTPLTVFSFAVDYSVFGLNPAGYHAMNLLLHVFNALLVYKLFRMVLNGRARALLVAALFAVHPLHVESVAWIAERKDMLYTFFFLASAIFYIEWKREWCKAKAAASLVFFALSLLSKPMAVSLPFVLLLLDWLDGRGNWKRLLLEKLPYFAMSAGLVFVLAGGDANMRVPGAIGLRLLTPLYNLFFYARKLAFPCGLSAVYNNPSGGMMELAVYALLTLLCGWLVWKKFRSDKIVMAGLAFYIVTLLPVLQLVPFGPVIAADRYSYVPSLGLFLIFAYALGKLPEKFPGGARQVRIFAVTFSCLLVLGFGFMARARASVWQDSIKLWTDTIEKQPNPMAFSGLGNAWLEKGRADIASGFFEAALKLNPDHLVSLIGLANCRYEANDLPGALKFYSAALAVDLANDTVHANIASVSFALGDKARAVGEMKKAIAIAGYAPQYWSALASYLLSQSDYAGAKDALLRSYAQAPSTATAGHLCALYCGTGECAAGEQYCRRAGRH